jgi:hypothetical protein
MHPPFVVAELPPATDSFTDVRMKTTISFLTSGSSFWPTVSARDCRITREFRTLSLVRNFLRLREG